MDSLLLPYVCCEIDWIECISPKCGYVMSEKSQFTDQHSGAQWKPLYWTGCPILSLGKAQMKIVSWLVVRPWNYGRWYGEIDLELKSRRRAIIFALLFEVSQFPKMLREVNFWSEPSEWRILRSHLNIGPFSFLFVQKRGKITFVWGNCV